MKYNDDYATCEETRATIRIYPDEIDPDEITRRLGITPTSIQRAGDQWAPGRQIEINGWFLSSRGVIDSRDSRRHIDWILDQLEQSSVAFHELLRSGVRADISCFWRSASGHGGPTMSPHQSRRLAQMNLDLWFDVYMGGVDEDGDARKEDGRT